MNKRNSFNFFRGAVFCVIILFTFISCSSAPKNPEDIFVLRTQAEHWLRTGNIDAEQGKFENAFVIFTEAKRSAVLADDHSLIIRVCLSRGNVLLSLGRTEEAFAEWNQAIAEAEKFKNQELLSVSRIYLARGNLVSGRTPARQVLDGVDRESANIKSNRLYLAFSWQTRGLAHRALGEYRDAEDAFRRSLDIHEKDRYLENASYDWYTIASIRSLAGNTQGALQALEESIAIDRRIENSWGLASSYRAMGDIYKKTGRRNEAAESYARAKSIFEAMGNEAEAAEIDGRTEN